MESTGDSMGQHVHFECFLVYGMVVKVMVDPQKVLYGDYNSRFGDLMNYKVYHFTQGQLKTPYTYDSAEDYSSDENIL
ncbi:hypothetical protein [Virgibacillus pantothenticus]|uniref:hypothetical protein n=1 Tax=Virgibacillus pantothenticus TaxID=1473 RepID=UPI001BAFC28F|nr:hypothetical protein [Virgibacillus pantothenticus]